MHTIKNMSLLGPDQKPICSELDVISRLLHLKGADVLELGCGTAQKTRAIAESIEVNSIIAAEIDPTQHEINLKSTDIPTVTFDTFTAEDIPIEDNRFDVVMMFKSLHHVPMDCLDMAMKEIARVLKPGGYAYISEPCHLGSG